ncbi:RNA polymerase Rpb4 family protein [Methanocorpusculum vombati]|uniref:DNA-directed RNA polymerase subunit Rpo4 n=1 Tax=Methanocorpusculum vombati TaxID=3002864 RepID=A0ABT4IP10_9EURY|nr:RNA polymerase Rpb4 family protein [Methanocorpusculum vombati]MDE2520282.1 RNA polymerase Rpb4 family protein [Methanocorpusculum sp.]MCZ0863059.1 RNA polymerase Rpb4 family protein [Methanocorpusculum vombati]MDE2534631.1 RNA polymerase Rpb4 family protein [Methanocorpusculum sp.]MDE2547033.1 RNA polymerase Rpb4 family protein [Methanocorpusculum sp.]MDE2548642.1 RNA polymerase Rpb4 family protein [Methanocorpusculum sp.]
MKVKKVISEEMMSLPELREVLISIRDQRAGGDGETETSARTMSYELRKSIDHADSLGKCDPATANVIIDELNGLEKIRPEIAYRIVNIMPESRDELRAIYAKERYTLLPEDLDQILDILRQHA